MRPASRVASWFAGLLLAGATLALAHDGGHALAKGGVGQPWDFTLPTLDGTRFVRAAQIKGPVLVNFWGRDCPPCVRELPLLEDFARAHPDWTVLLVATDPHQEAAEFLARQGIALTTLRGGANVSALMRAAGNRSGALPFSVGIKGGTLCATRVGELQADTLNAWRASAC